MKTNRTTLIKLLKLWREISISKIGKGIRKRRGRPLIYGPRSIAAIFLIMMTNRIRTFKGVHKFLKENPIVRRYCGLKRLPDRATLSRRLRGFFNQLVRERTYLPT